MQTTELTGSALNWAVAELEGWNSLHDAGHSFEWFSLHRPKYTTDWIEGGPIIQKAIDKLCKNIGGTYSAQIKYRIPYYSSTYDADIGADAFINAHGATMLEAAMRCYVKSKLGDEVEIPEELL